MTRFAVCLAAAGSGTRMGRSLPKQYLRVAGRPLLMHTVRRFASLRECGQIVIATDDLPRVRALLARHAPEAPVTVVPGGARRQDSVASALDAVEARFSLVLIHDAARPCTPPALIRQVAQTAARHGAAILAIPASDTVKCVSEDVIVSTLDRSRLWLAQTPQAAHRDLWIRAFRETTIEATDDASLLEALGIPVHIVQGSRSNLKVTTPEDLVFVEALLTPRRSRR